MKYNVVLSDKVQKLKSELPIEEQKELDSAFEKLAENPLENAQPVSGGLIEVLTILEEIGANTFTMELTPEQQELFNKKAQEVFGEDWKEKLKEISKELQS